MGYASTCLLLAGCATAQFYPVCVLDTGHAEPAELWLAAKPRLAVIIEAVVGNSLNKYYLEIDGVVIKAYAGEHEQLSRIWPNFACIIAEDAGAGREILLDQCRGSVVHFLVTRPAYWPAVGHEGAPRCASPSSTDNRYLKAPIDK